MTTVHVDRRYFEMARDLKGHFETGVLQQAVLGAQQLAPLPLG
jgi:hypothetical protein